MPGFDPEIGKLAQRVLINPRKIDHYTGVFATKVLNCPMTRCVYNLLHTYADFLPNVKDNSCKRLEASDY